MNQRFLLDPPIDGYGQYAELRVPVAGDEYLAYDIIEDEHTGRVITCPDANYTGGPRLIVKRAWTPPEFLPDGVWLYKYHPHGTWWTSADKPSQQERFGPSDFVEAHGNEVGSLHVSSLADLHEQEFVPPPTDCIQVQR